MHAAANLRAPGARRMEPQDHGSEEATMTGDQLAAAGRLLYGEREWLVQLGNALAAGERNLRRFLNEGAPDPVRERCRQLLEERQAQIAALLAELDPGFQRQVR